MTQSDRRLEDILKPIVYADIFDFPLTFEEVYRFVEFRASRRDVQHLLDRALALGKLCRVDGFYSLPQRTELVQRRRERQYAADALWPKALFYGRWIASLPFVRMVAITGSLAVENPRDGSDDIDFLIVTQPGRLWLCRALIVLMVKYGHRRGVHLCPNYLITENVLQFEENNLFVAREIVQMVPIYGEGLYRQMWHDNRWIAKFLPQGREATLARLDDRLAWGQRLLKRGSEGVLRGRLGSWLEAIVQQKQIEKHTRRAAAVGATDHVTFTADVCKGHYDAHGHKTMTAYEQRLHEQTLVGDV